MLTTPAAMPQNDANSNNKNSYNNNNNNNNIKNNNNNTNMSWTSRCLVLLRRRASVTQWNPKDDTDADGKTQHDLESCTTATIVSCTEDEDDDEMTTITTTDHEDENEHDSDGRQDRASRVSFDPHVVTVEFDKEEEGRQEDMWIRSEEWNRMDMELHADVARFHLAVFAPPASLQEPPVGGCDVYGHQDEDDDDDDSKNLNDGYQEDESEDDDVDLSSDDDRDVDEEPEMDTDQARIPDFAAFRGLEHSIFPHRCQMRRRMVLRAVLLEQAQQEEYDDDDAVENIAEASQVWSRRDAYRAWEMGQADAHVVRMELLHEWKLQQQRRREERWDNPMSL